ncbi:MAG: YqiA/YcfP family alpha/beta fold hydrolase, partial [Prolixibacteraceae bacterium]
MNILYLHGLGSTGLTDDKRAVVMSVLKPEVLIAPVFDYTEEGVEKKIEDLFHAHSFDLIIGSSTGAMVAHTLSCRSNINAILINPAFKHNVVDRLLPKFIRSTEVGKHTFFVFGTAVSSKMIRFSTAAILFAIFVVLGAVLDGAGGMHT